MRDRLRLISRHALRFTEPQIDADVEQLSTKEIAMKRNTLYASLVASLFVVAGLAQANEDGAAEASSSAGTIMEDVHPVGGRATLVAPLEIESVFPSQGSDGN